jgi:hypothetical protein
MVAGMHLPLPALTSPAPPVRWFEGVLALSAMACGLVAMLAVNPRRRAQLRRAYFHDSRAWGAGTTELDGVQRQSDPRRHRSGWAG